MARWYLFYNDSYMSGRERERERERLNQDPKGIGRVMCCFLGAVRSTSVPEEVPASWENDGISCQSLSAD